MESFKYGNGVWATKEGSSLAYNDENGNYKPLPFSVTRDSIATRVNKQGLIEVVGKDKLRIDYTDSTKGVALLEPSRTNRLPYSNDFTNAVWSKVSGGTGIAPTVTANYAISPDGTQNATRLQINKGSGTTSSDYSSIGDNISFFSSSGSLSIYIKSNDTNTYKIALRNYNDITICNVTTEWQRFDFENSTNPTMFQLILSGNYDTSDNADLLIYGAQLEEGSYATSYIPTSGSAVPRAADVANGAGNSEVFNDSEGVLYADIAKDATGVDGGIAISDSNYTNRVLFYFDTSGNIRAYVYSSGEQARIDTSVLDYTQNNKLALKYSATSTKFFVNGFQVGNTDTGSTMPVGLSELAFDDGGGGSDFYGKAKRIGYFDAVLTDAELEALTSYTSFTNMANELNLTIK